MSWNKRFFISIPVAAFGTFLFTYDLPTAPYHNFICKVTFFAIFIVFYAWLGVKE